MGKYFEAIRREGNLTRLEPIRYAKADEHLRMRKTLSAVTEFSSAADEPRVLLKIAKSSTIRRISERLAPKARLGEHVRVLFAGCRPGDGCSTVAGALAFDLSERLGLTTLLVDANFSRPGLHRLFSIHDDQSQNLTKGAFNSVQDTHFAQLKILTASSLTNLMRDPRSEIFDELANSSSVVVCDLGVVRLDARTLNLVRPSDPLLLVARYGHTEFSEILDTTAALRAAERSPVGVILNAAQESIPTFVRRFLGLRRN